MLCRKIGVLFLESLTLRKMSQVIVHPIAESGYASSQFYDRFRPTYSKEAVSLLVGKLGLLTRNSTQDLQPARILELGAGTGKFTGILKDVLQGSNVEIIASEPVLSMRQEFAKHFPDLEMKDFSAENIALPDSSVHAVCAAQSFHWFANDRSLSEIHRVLVPGGKLGLIWNTRDNSVPWVKEMHEEIVFPIYAQTNTPNQRTFEWKKVLEASDKFGPLECNENFKFEQTFSTCDGIINRTMSSSVIQVKSEVEKQMIKDKIKLLLRKHEVDQQNEIVLPHVVLMCWCEKK